MVSIKVNNLSKSYGNKAVIKDMNFEFEKGQNYLLYGNSGIGKTTFFNILKGYEDYDDGKIEINGNIAYLFQDELLFSNLTVRENIIVKNTKCCKNEEYIAEILKKLGISNLIDNRINTLSGGERQRVEFALILIESPDIVLFDEPTSKLDSSNKENVIELMSDAFRDKTLIVASHEKKYFDEYFEILNLKEGMEIDV